MTLPPPDLPPISVAAYQELSEDQKVAFVAAYNDRRRSTPLMVALAILFPIQLFFLDRILLGVLFVITGGGLGIWYVIEWFLTPKRVLDYNTKVASETLSLVKADGTTAADVETEEE